MPLDDFQILTGEEVKESFKPDELSVLVDLWTQETVESTNPSIEEMKKSTYEHLQEVLIKGDMVIAKINNEVIGMVRVYKLDHVAPNQYVEGDVFEIGKALVTPNWRGKGVYKKIREQAVVHLREKYGDVAILAGTKTDSIKNMNRNDDWNEIGFEEYMRIHGATEDVIKENMNEILKKEWTAFLYIPKKN